jgi:hypothetical protein
MKVIHDISDYNRMACVVAALENQIVREMGRRTWHLATMSTSSQRTSTSFPFPSSPHCAPTIALLAHTEQGELTDDSDTSRRQLYGAVVHLFATELNSTQ